MNEKRKKNISTEKMCPHYPTEEIKSIYLSIKVKKREKLMKLYRNYKNSTVIETGKKPMNVITLLSVTF